jgi:3-oxoacyl-[acyl-carrier-protein] synthase II
LAFSSDLRAQSSNLPISITGLGLCSPLGETLVETWEALLAGRFITDHSRAAGEYDEPRVCSLADRAARAAIAEAQWTAGDLADAALVVGTSKGPIESWLAPQSSARLSSTLRLRPEGSLPKSVLRPPSCLLGLSGIAAGLNFIGGPRLTISTACASGLHALIRGAMLLGEGYSRVLVVAAESSLHPLFVGSFKRLGVVAPPEIGCRPFDLDRAGFLVSEMASAVCLERRKASSTLLRPGGIHIERFAMGGDATHLTGGDPQGRMLRRLLATVIDGRPVDLIHAHGTGTKANDAVELAAIEAATGDKRDGRSFGSEPLGGEITVDRRKKRDGRCFESRERGGEVHADGEREISGVDGSSGEKRDGRCFGSAANFPSVYSHKGALGHSLGAAGLVSVALNCLCHGRDCVPPNVRTRRPMEMEGVRLSTGVVRREVRRSVVVASGFGGAGAAVALRSVSAE